MRILYVHATLVPPPTDVRTDRFYLLSDLLEGEILQPVWFQTPAEVRAVFGADSYPAHTVGRFRYHWILSPEMGTLRQRLKTFWSYIKIGLRLHRERRFDCIVAYSHMTTGLIAGCLKILTRSKLVIEIVTCPHLVYITERPRPGVRERVMKIYSDICLHLSVALADRMHYLFPGQLSEYPLLRRARNSVFHEFVPVSSVERAAPSGDAEPYVLLVGMPWYLKGVDVVIEAFKRIAGDFPGVKLKLLGYFADQERVEALIGDERQIVILKARPNPEALKLIAQALALVQPSRCEGLSRVLMEGMAAGIPVIATEVGGTPTIVRDGENGFLVPVGDSRALGIRMRELLTDGGLRRRLGDCGYARAHNELNEQVYVEKFAGMIRAAVQGSE